MALKGDRRRSGGSARTHGPTARAGRERGGTKSKGRNDSRNVRRSQQKGVIHRVLKPGNILVTEEGQPKILDFGVARATDSDLQQTTMQTDVGALIGTLPYMSPEQVGGDPAELDTRSDVYALGVILFELLARRLPYSLERRMIHEAARVIREEEPSRLSSINKTLRGDVETIVAHALEKEKSRRYQTASALGYDAKAAAWRSKLEELQASTRPAGHLLAWTSNGAGNRAGNTTRRLTVASRSAGHRSESDDWVGNAAPRHPPHTPKQLHSHPPAWRRQQRGNRSAGERTVLAQMDDQWQALALARPSVRRNPPSPMAVFREHF